MAKKLKDNMPFLSAVLLACVLLAAVLTAKNAGPALLTAAAIFIFLIVIRIIKVARKNILRYLNGPRRFCKGRGIEIGSGAKAMLKDSILVDMVDSFSNDKSYKVDYLADAHEIPKIKSASMDYVCASHVLEHLTNPIKAVLEWLRVLKPGGIIWLRIPDKRKTFDRPRKRTTLSHLIEDFDKSIPADDPTHIEDNNRNTDPPRKLGHPYVHNHVWIPEDVAAIFNYIDDKLARLEITRCQTNTSPRAQDFWIVVRKP